MKRVYLLVLVPVVLAACNNTTNTSTTPSSAPDTNTALTSTVPAAMMANEMKVDLAALNNSGQSGTATLTEDGGKVKVTLALTGNTVATPEPAHIHVGSCPNPGAIKFNLNDVVNGNSETTIDTTLDALKTSGPLAINVHKSKTEISTYLACGDLPTAASGSPAAQ